MKKRKIFKMTIIALLWVFLGCQTTKGPIYQATDFYSVIKIEPRLGAITRYQILNSDHNLYGLSLVVNKYWVPMEISSASASVNYLTMESEKITNAYISFKVGDNAKFIFPKNDIVKTIGDSLIIISPAIELPRINANEKIVLRVKGDFKKINAAGNIIIIS